MPVTRWERWLPTAPGPQLFGALRILLGAYLLVHFLYLVPHAEALFSNVGMVADASLNLSYGYFPNPLNALDAPWMVQGFLLGLAGGSLAVLLGRRPGWLLVLLWFGWACLLNRNVFIRNPSMPYVGWMLLMLTLVPRGEAFVPGRPVQAGWRMPRRLLVALWALLAVGYTLSGLDKSASPSWQDGTALAHVLSNPLSRDHGLVRLLLSQPEVLRGMTWGALALEIGFLPLALHPRTRPLVWAAMVTMQVGILLLVDFADLTLGMLVAHAFTLDPAWLPAPLRARIAPHSLEEPCPQPS